MQISVCPLFLGLLLCFLLGCVTKASPLVQTAISGDEFDSPETGKTPNLFSMLNVLKGGSDIRVLMSLLKDLDFTRESVKKWMAMSPLMKNILGTASRKNIKLKIFLQLIQGRAPDLSLRDLYQLATTKTKGITSDLISAVNNNKMFNKFRTLRKESGIDTSPGKLQEMIKIYTGMDISVSPDLVKGLNGGKYRVTSGNMGTWDFLECCLFVLDNWYPLADVVESFGKGDVDFIKALQRMPELDSSRLEKIMAPPQTVNNTKYTVTGGSLGLVQDPDITRILQYRPLARTLLATDPNAQGKAEAAVVDFMARFLNVCTRSLQMAEVENGISQQTGDKPSMLAIG